MNKLFAILLMFPLVIKAQSLTILPQANVYFNLGSGQLTTAAKHTIDSLLYADALPPGKTISLVGYADAMGDEKVNMGLSRKRSEAVAAYLKFMGMDESLIVAVDGRGEVERAERAGGYPQDRKVAIISGDVLPKTTLQQQEDGTLIGTVHFKFTAASLRPEAIKLLDSMVGILKKNPKMQVNVNGFVCCFNYDNLQAKTYNLLWPTRTTDTARLNGAKRLSMSRSRAIAAYFSNHGIAPTA